MLTLKPAKTLIITAAGLWLFVFALFPASSEAQVAIHSCPDGTKRAVPSHLSQEDKQAFCNSDPRTTEECNRIANAGQRQVCLEVEAPTRGLPNSLSIVNCPDGTRRTVPKTLSEEDKRAFCNSQPRTVDECNQIRNAEQREACIAYEANQASTVPGLPPPSPVDDTGGSDATSGVNLTADCQETSVNKENCGIVGYLVVFIRVLSALVGIVIVTMITVGGIQYSSSRDNPQAVAAAKGRITNAIIALLTYIFMMSFLQWIVPGGVL